MCLSATPAASLEDSARAVSTKLAGSQIDFSPEAVDDLERFRSALRLVTDEVLARQAASVTADALEKELVSAFAGRGVRTPPDDAPGASEFALATFQGVDVEVPEDHPSLRVVRLHLGVHDCGGDTMFRVYRNDGRAWGPVLVDHAGRFKNIATGEIALKWAMTPSAPDGSFLVLIASQNPWCQSSWQTLRWRLYRLRDESGPAEQLEQQAAFAFTEFGWGYEVEVAEASVRLTATLALDFDPGSTRLRILRWRLLGGKVRREVLAGDARGFLDEWLLARWGEARRWTNPDAKEAQAWHRQLARRNLRQCDVELVGQGEGEPKREVLLLECAKSAPVRFVVSELEPNHYRLESVGQDRPHH